MSTQPLRFLLLLFAGWINRQQADIIAYLLEENRALREKLGDKPVRLSKVWRRRLAAKGKVLGRKLLRDVASVATPDTILRWYRKLVADKYDGSKNRAPGPGRPRTKLEIRTKDHRYLIVDRDPLYTKEFRDILSGHGVETLRLPARSPNLNAYAERFVLSIKSECLNHIVPLGVGHLRRAIREFAAHYHFERNHQGIDNELITPMAEPVNENAPIQCRERLVGLLKSYHRAA